MGFDDVRIGWEKMFYQISYFSTLSNSAFSRPASIDRKCSLQWTCSKRASRSIASSCAFFSANSFSFLLHSLCSLSWSLLARSSSFQMHMHTNTTLGHTECFSPQDSVRKVSAFRNVIRVFQSLTRLKFSMYHLGGGDGHPVVLFLTCSAS